MDNFPGDPDGHRSLDNGAGEYEIEASIIEELRKEAFHITCDWAAEANKRAQAFSLITKPLHEYAYELLAAIHDQPLNLAIRDRLTKVDCRLAKIYRSGTTTPSGYDALPLGLKIQFQQLRRVGVESSYFNWCIQTRDEYEHMHFSKKLRGVIGHKNALVEEQLGLLEKRDQKGGEDESMDRRILEIQDHIFAGDHFTDRDRLEHTVQMEMIEARRKIDKEIRGYVAALLSHERYEEAQWAGEFFTQVETQRVALETDAAQEKQANKEKQQNKRDALHRYIREEFERRKKDRMSKANSGEATQTNVDVTPDTSTSKRLQDGAIVSHALSSNAAFPLQAETLDWAEETNELAAATPQYQKSAQYTSPAPRSALTRYNGMTGRILLRVDYQPPGGAIVEDLRNPHIFNRQLFDIESTALLQSMGIPRMTEVEANDVYNQLLLQGKVANHVLDLIAKRRKRHEHTLAELQRLHKLKADEAKSKAQGVMGPGYRAQHALQQHKHAFYDALKVQQHNASMFKRFVQDQVSEPTIEHHYRHFLSREYTRINPSTGLAVVTRAEFSDQFRAELGRMIQDIVRQGEAMWSEKQRQALYAEYCGSEKIKTIWRMTGQRLNALEKRKSHSEAAVEKPMSKPEAAQKKAPPKIRLTLPEGIGPTMMTNASTVASGNSSPGLYNSTANRRSSATTLRVGDGIQSQIDAITRRPSVQINPDVKPNHSDKLRLLQALQDKAIVRRTGSPEPVTTGEQRRAPAKGYEVMWMGNIFGFRSTHDPSPLGMTTHEYAHWVKLHERSKKMGHKVNAASHQYGMAADVRMQVALMKTLDTGVSQHLVNVQATLAHAEARMPVDNILQQQQRGQLHQHRGPSIGSHIAHAGFDAARMTAPTRLGQFAHTADTAKTHSPQSSAESNTNSIQKAANSGARPQDHASHNALTTPVAAFAATILAASDPSHFIDPSSPVPATHPELYTWRHRTKKERLRMKLECAATAAASVAEPPRSASDPARSVDESCSSGVR